MLSRCAVSTNDLLLNEQTPLVPGRYGFVNASPVVSFFVTGVLYRKKHMLII